MTALACIFGGKLEGARSPPLTPSATEKTDTQEEQRTKDKQEKRKKNFPTKTTTAGRCGSLWHLLLMDGCLQLFCALRTRHHHTAQASPAWHPHPAPTDGRNGRRGPPSQAASPQTPAASHQRELRGASAGCPHPHRLCLPKTGDRRRCWRGLRARWAEEARGSRPALALLGTRAPTQVLWDPREGPASSLHLGLPAPPLLADLFGRTHLSMQSDPTPTPGMRGHAAPDPPASARTRKVISTLTEVGEPGNPTPRPLEAGGAGSKCLTPPPARRRPHPRGPAPHRRAPAL